MEELLTAYKRHVRLPWESRIAAGERVWFGLYGPFEERRLRLRLSDFEVETLEAGYGWLAKDLSDDMATRITLLYYTDAREALEKAISH